MSTWLREAWESFRFTLGSVFDPEAVGEWLAVMAVAFILLLALSYTLAGLGAFS